MSAFPVDKDAVARNFSAAAATYDGWAPAQAAIAGALVDRLPSAFSPALVVDLGCGTGMLSSRLLARYPGARLVGVDLAEGMVARCREEGLGRGRATFRVGDAEDPASLPPGADLVASSCACQWFASLPSATAAWAAALPPGGIIALAALVEGSYAELAEAHREAFGLPFPGLDYPSAAEVEALAAVSGLRLCAADAIEVISKHADARDALRSFRKIGATLPGRRPLGPGETRRLLDALGRRAGEGGIVPLTHRAFVLVAEKPS